MKPLTKTQIMKRLEEIISRDTTGHCLCGSFEFCEHCSPSSGENILRDKLSDLLREAKGIPKLIPDYGGFVVINLNDDPLALEPYLPGKIIRKRHKG